MIVFRIRSDFVNLSDFRALYSSMLELSAFEFEVKFFLHH